MRDDLAGMIGRLEAARGRRILVIGDLILDRYIWGSVDRISPEAPVPVLELTHETYTLGGAANVAHNLAILGARVDLVGLVGADQDRDRLVGLCRDAGIETAGVLEDARRPTTTKTRVIGHNQQIVRIDREQRTSLGPDQVAAASRYLEAVFPSLDAVVVSDYSKGTVTEALLDELRRLCRARPVPVVVDPKSTQFAMYRDFSVMTPNQIEAGTGAGFKIRDELTLVEAGYKLRASLNLEAVLITRGANGMSLFEKGKDVVHIPTVARNVYDVTGAGDTVTSVMALALAADLSFVESSHLANCAAGVVVGKFGTATVTLDELGALAPTPGA
ncbi:MAG: D-glycero-beta-D-manno-heptose-7-phosphate kinase [Candidatus Riflebacteria bacterium]|nr:D-glycero-beta-D-manno-heptose-7-phosphate kinase [Candidatus Riflebacteria bacterium]